MEVFELTETQTNYILDMPLRRLTRFSRIELETERNTLQPTITELTEILDSPEQLRTLVGNQLAEVARLHGTPRRTILLAASGAAATGGHPRWRWPTTRAGCCCPPPACWPAPTMPTRSRRGRGPPMT